MLEDYGVKIEGLGDSNSELAMLALRLGKYLSALMFTFAFLVGHMIPFGDKHQPALRTAMM